MNVQSRIDPSSRRAATPADRVAELDWKNVADELDAQGSAVLENLLSPEECREHRLALSR